MAGVLRTSPTSLSPCMLMLLLGLLAAIDGADGVGSTCRGALQFEGVGEVQVVAAEVYSPSIPGKGVQVLDSVDGGAAIAPRIPSRAYLSDWCRNDTYQNTWFTVLRLLGMRLRYTVDLRGAGCGCSAGLSLVPMFQRKDRTECGDHYCDAAGTCGSRCSEINVQEANQHLWHSTLHALQESEGTARAFGDTSGRENDNKYGPNGTCINTSRPFEVIASFPVDSNGHLEAMEVQLSQPGSRASCDLMRVSVSRISSRWQLSEALYGGLVPVISYQGSGDVRWPGSSACHDITAWQCEESVKFSSFAVEPLGGTASPALERAAAKEEIEEAVVAQELEQSSEIEKACVEGWRQPEECVGSFTFRGEELHGCTFANGTKPWCSRLKVYHDYTGDYSFCQPCGSNPLAPSAAAAATAEASAGTTAASRRIVPECAMAGHVYQPLDLLGTVPTFGGDPTQCQRRCAAEAKCVHFTFVGQDGSCHLADEAASLRLGQEGSFAGPASCSSDHLLVMRRFLEGDRVLAPPGARGTPGFMRRRPFAWVASAVLALIALVPASVAVTALTRRPTPSRSPSSARTVSRSELLGADAEEGLTRESTRELQEEDFVE